MEKYGKRTQWTAKAMERLDLPVDLAPGLPKVEVAGDREFYMERHRGILSYSTEAVDINGGAVTVRVTGKNLQVVAMSDNELRLRGTIERVEWVK
jgi:sporulation protein YqfC